MTDDAAFGRFLLQSSPAVRPHCLPDMRVDEVVSFQAVGGEGGAGLRKSNRPMARLHKTRDQLRIGPVRHRSLRGTMPNSSSEFDVVGPTIADDVRRLIRRYGRSALKEAVQRQTRRKRGVKPKSDWHDLEEILKEDAARWLDGGNPFKERGNRTIAKKIAADQPGHSIDGTFDRIRKKLIKDRCYFTLVYAAQLSEDNYPHVAHLRALQALVDLGRQTVWADQLHHAHKTLTDYSTKFGNPARTLTMREIEIGASKALRAEPMIGDRNVLQILVHSRHK